MVHTRSHDMSADIYTKGFVDRQLFHRLKMLTNIYSLEEIDANDLNPAPLDADHQPVPLSNDLNTQYAIITGGMSSKQQCKKAVKVKAKAKAKPKPVHRLPVPPAKSNACVVDVGTVGEADVSWFARVDYGASRLV